MCIRDSWSSFFLSWAKEAGAEEEDNEPLKEKPEKPNNKRKAQDEGKDSNKEAKKAERETKKKPGCKEDGAKSEGRKKGEQAKESPDGIAIDIDMTNLESYPPEVRRWLKSQSEGAGEEKQKQAKQKQAAATPKATKFFWRR